MAKVEGSSPFIRFETLFRGARRGRASPARDPGAAPSSSPVAVAGSTLATAALFNPLRRRVQRLVDRRFNRARYDADLAIARFTAALRDAVDLAAIETRLLDGVNQTLAPAHAAVWIRPSERS